MALFGAPLRKWALTAAVVYGVVRAQKASQHAREELDATMKEAIDAVKKASGSGRADAFAAAERLLKSYEKQGATNLKRWRERLEEWRVTEGD